MSVERYLLDTSALLSLIEDEAGAGRVEEVLQTQSVWLPWTALLELYYITEQERGRVEADQRYALSLRLPATVVWLVDEAILITAARLKAAHRLSFADAMIAATAIQLKATLIHKDPEFEVVPATLLQERLPYKKTI